MAAFFWIHAGANANWSTVNNWSATSGGGTNSATPSSTSDVTFDGAGTHGNEASTISGTITILSFTVTSGYTQTITHSAVLTIAGNVTFNTSYTIAGASNLTISAASTITSGGKTWPNGVSFTNANTKTLSGDWTISGTLTVTTGSTTTITSNTLTVGGLSASAVISGTTAIALTGGTWSGTSAIQSNMTISGTVTISGSVAYNTGTLTCTSGTITTTSSTLTVAGSTTFNTSSISWNNITTTIDCTITLNSLLTATGILKITFGTTVTFAGTSGFTVGTWQIDTLSAQTHTLVNGVTYTVTTSLLANKSRSGAILTITSDHASNLAILTLNNGCSCNLLANMTRIDGSAGRAIWTFIGTVTSCLNVFSITDLSFVTGSAKVIQGMSNY